ncbi:uncharacterized protein [Cherax quadricarinatus]|uniref:uncharacterized protein isoform X3 n=1 Tax=Cherax quadricarinatus TaxID=27406 RepID=UPI00387E9338
MSEKSSVSSIFTNSGVGDSGGSGSGSGGSGGGGGDGSNMEEVTKKKGMHYGLAAFFLVAQMAGAGFLALPNALVDVGWLGIPMMLLFCFSVSFAAIRLGRSYVILEERWPEYKEPARQPYMEIAYRSMGSTGRKLTMVTVVVNLFGSATVFIILICEMLASLLMYATSDDSCAFNKCQMVIIVGVALIPFTWLGTPKDFWQASVLAVTATAAAVVVIIVEIFAGQESIPDHPRYPNPTVSSFSLGFGSILFAYGGAAVFPTIQNDMEDRSLFWKSIYIGFTDFNWRRCVVRSVTVLLQMLICLAIPDFGLILNLIGGSLITLCTFVLPPLMYMRLIDDHSGPWKHRTMAMWERIFLVEIIIVGVIGGVCSTITAVYEIVEASFQESCFTTFSHCTE